MRVSRAEFISRVDDLTDQAETEPVTITQGGRDRVVLVSADEYARLVDRDGVASASNDPTKGKDTDLIESRGEMPELWGALRDTVIYVSDDIAEPTGEFWDVAR